MHWSYANGSTFTRYAQISAASITIALLFGRDRCWLYVTSTCQPEPTPLNCSFIRFAVFTLPAIFCRATDRFSVESNDAAAAGGGVGADVSYPKSRITAPTNPDCRLSESDPRTDSRNGLNCA